MERPRAFISDLGGVLVKVSFDSFFKAMANASGKSAEEVRNLLSLNEKHFKSKINRDFGTGRTSAYDFYEEVCHTLQTRKENMGFQTFTEKFNDIFTEIKETTSLLESVRRQFDAMVMITNINPLHYDHLRSKIPHIFAPFDCIVASHKYPVNCLKPAPRIYSYAVKILKRYEIRPENSIFVDDLFENIVGAHKAGISNAFLFDTVGSNDSAKGLKTFLNKLKAAV